jgi:hypothetical protein
MTRDVLVGAAWGTAGGIWLAVVIAIVFTLRWAGKRRDAGDRLATKTPVPGGTPSARITQALLPGTGPLTSVHFYADGLTVVDDHMRQRTIEIAPVTEGEADAAFLARIERELREP